MPTKSIPIRNLGSKGVISDLAPYDTPADSWSDARNIRFVDNKAKKIGGSVPVFYKNRINVDVTNDQVPLHLVQKPLSEESWFWASKNEVWETNGWTHTQVLNKDVHLNVDLNNPWTSTVIANSVIMNSFAFDPIGKSPSENEFNYIPKWGPWKARVVRSYKNFALALNLTEGPFTYSQRIRWSNIVPPNSLPADWGWDIKEDGSVGDPIKGSAGGYNDLTMALGEILEGAELKDSFIIYTNKEVLALDYVGGNDIFRVRKIFSDAGILNTNCVAAFDNKHLVISAGDVYVHNGSSKQSIVTGKVKERLIGELTENSFESVKVITYEPQKEVWIMYAGSDATGVFRGNVGGSAKEATKAAIYNWQYDTWTFIDIPKALDIKFGPVPTYGSSEEERIDTWQTLEDTELWENTLKLWGGLGKDFKNQALLIGSTDGHFYSVDQGDYTIKLVYKKDIPPGTNNPYDLIAEQILSKVTKNYLDLDDVGADIIGYKQITAIYPQIEGDGEFYFRIGGSHNPSGSIEWGPRQRFLAGQDYKVDTRQNYRYLSIQIDNMTEGTWSLTGYDMLIYAGGRR